MYNFTLNQIQNYEEKLKIKDEFIKKIELIYE